MDHSTNQLGSNTAPNRKRKETPTLTSDPRDRKQQFLYLTTKGWRTGTPHRIEIWYVQHKGWFYLVSQFRDRSHWVQNIRHDPEVSFQIGTSEFHGRGRIVDPREEPELTATVSRLMHEKYQWNDGLIIELRAEPGSHSRESDSQS